jgi:hypothetical protein
MVGLVVIRIGYTRISVGHRIRHPDRECRDTVAMDDVIDISSISVENFVNHRHNSRFELRLWQFHRLGLLSSGKRGAKHQPHYR